MTQAEHSEADSAVFAPVTDLLTKIQKELAAKAVWIVSSMPRGGLQIVQPSQLSDAILRPYARDYHGDDALTWRAIRENRAINSAELAGTARYLHFLKGAGFAHAAAAPLASPVFEGYAGALHVTRSADQPAFTSADLSRLAAAAGQLDRMIAADRQQRSTPAQTVRNPSGQWIFDSDGKPLLGKGQSPQLDEALIEQMADQVKHAVSHLGIVQIAQRLPLPDSHGDFWTFRVLAMPRYPALSDGAVVFFCAPPTCDEWALLRSSDVSAEEEISRLVPAVRFMVHEFHRGPTLREIARAAHLSPFHFHRRFTELMGLTPKHLMLECQITKAKRDLLARKKELTEIAAECGFAHQSHFTSRFKQAVGLTPTGWRRIMSEVLSPVTV